LGRSRLHDRTWSGGAALETPGPVPALAMPGWARGCKRVVDIVGAALVLLVVLPLLLLAMVAVHLDSPGPVIFRQVRLGARGRSFVLYKLRTMRPDCDDSPHQEYVSALIRGSAESSDGVFKLVGDSRVTRLGRILRRWSVDELPQLWNVLRGDMSLVGPRPPLPREGALYDTRTWGRLAVKPGLTGLWQVSGRCRLSFAEMVELDLRYVHSWSVGMELGILLRTPAAILSARGAA